MRIVFAVIGALIGARFALEGARFFGMLVGGAVGFTIADLSLIRAQIRSLEQQMRESRAVLLRSASQERSSAAPIAPAAPAAQPVATPHDGPAESSTKPDDLRWRDTEDAAEPQESALPPAASAATAPAAAAAQRTPADRPWPASEPEIPLIAAVRGLFTGDNALVRVGVIVLFFGVAFLLRYLAEHSKIPIELRLTGIAFGGIVLLALGWRLRKSRTGYALALQGGGVGVLYLTVFAAMRLYSVLPESAAFALLALVAVLSAILAVLQNSLSFALLGVTGGFLAPILASSGHGSHVVLFSYYAMLNAGIFVVAWFKAWRPLNMAGFLFTFAIGTLWGVLQYRPEDFATTEPFLVLFFLFYVGIAVLFTDRQRDTLNGFIDGMLVFGNPIVAFGLQSTMLHGRLFALAYSALAASALYLGIAWLLKRRAGAAQSLLTEAFIAIGVAFLTLAVPLALDARWNVATWALEGGALIWLGCRQGRALPRIAGAILTAAAGCIAAGELHLDEGRLALPLGAAFSVLVLSAASIFSARTVQVHREKLNDFEALLPPLLLSWGLLWWTIGGLAEMANFVPYRLASAAALVFMMVTALGSSELYRRLQIAAARIAALLLLPIMVLFAVKAAMTLVHPFADGGWVSWPLAFAGFYWLAHRHEGAADAGLASAMHVVSAWLLCGLSSWEAAWAVGEAIAGSRTWVAVAWAIIPGCVLISLPRLVTRVQWPFARHRDTYLLTVGVGLGVYLGFWSVTTNLVLPGDAAPLRYVPLINPLDVAQAFVLLALARYGMFLRATRSDDWMNGDARVAPALLAGLAFVWVNGVLLRTLHQWAGVPFAIHSFVESTIVETALSIFWTLLALGTMLLAVRKHSRLVWFVGAALLVAVIAKLFFVDLSNSGSIDRIVSFVGVGLLIMVVGYFSPIPPAAESRP